MKHQARIASAILGLKEVTEKHEELPVVCGYSCGRTKEERIEYVRQSCQLHFLTVGGSNCYDYHFDADRWFTAWQVTPEGQKELWYEEVQG